MSLGKCLWANVSGQMSYGKCHGTGQNDNFYDSSYVRDA
jgi:hypothetical protein